jgi:hypothetical protein
MVNKEDAISQVGALPEEVAAKMDDILRLKAEADLAKNSAALAHLERVATSVATLPGCSP